MVTPVARVVGTCLIAAVGWGCRPADEGRASLLEEPRILAIQTSPAEVAPGKSVTVQLLRAGPSGREGQDQVTLDFCVARKPIAAPGIVAEECLALRPNDALLPIEQAEPFVATVPDDACALFGPKPATTENDEALRPTDPDTTGGYYQPMRAVDAGRISLYAARISCGLTGTNQETSIEYIRRYRANENPGIQKILFAHAGAKTETLNEADPARIQPGEQVGFAVTWSSCPTDQGECGDGICGIEENATDCPEDCSQAAVGCTGAETYLLLDPVGGQLRLQRENIRVSWYVTGGDLERDKSGRASDDLARDAQNQWTAPSKPGDYWLFAVIRDDRGGVGWAVQPLRVAE